MVPHRVAEHVAYVARPYPGNSIGERVDGKYTEHPLVSLSVKICEQGNFLRGDRIAPLERFYGYQSQAVSTQCRRSSFVRGGDGRSRFSAARRPDANLTLAGKQRD